MNQKTHPSRLGKITVSALVGKPAAVAWRFWTLSEHIAQWHVAPEMWRCLVAKNDVRAGGEFAFQMEAEGGAGIHLRGVYSAVEENKKLAYTLDDGRKAEVAFSADSGRTKIAWTVEAEEAQRKDWQAILNNFRKYVETYKRKPFSSYTPNWLNKIAFHALVVLKGCQMPMHSVMAEVKREKGHLIPKSQFEVYPVTGQPKWEARLSYRVTEFTDAGYMQRPRRGTQWGRPSWERDNWILTDKGLDAVKKGEGYVNGEVKKQADKKRHSKKEERLRRAGQGQIVFWKSKIAVSVVVNKPAAAVWRFWTLPAHITQWHFAEGRHCLSAKNDVRVGGEFSFRMEAKDGGAGSDFCGVYGAVEENKKLAYTLDGGRKAEVVFSADGGGTKIVWSFEAEKKHSEESQRNFRQSILNNFRKYAEVCPPARP